MFVLGALLVLSFGAVAHGAPRIIGGHDAANHKYPFLVVIRGLKENRICSGTILNERWILTSEACAEKVQNSTTITAGIHRLTEQGYNYTVKIVVINENATGGFNDNIALIRVVGAINFNDNVKPVVLPKANLGDYSQLATLPGWGSIRYGSSPSNTLQEVDLTVLTTAECNSKANYFNRDKICTSTANGKGFCFNDWGGPLLVNGTQVGIVSYMSGNCLLGSSYPNVFTRVWSYKDWIERTMDKYGPPEPTPTPPPEPIPTPPPPPLNGTIHFHLNLSLSMDGTLTFGNNTLTHLT